MKGDAFALGLGRRVAKPKIADRPQAAWQDVAKVSFHELRAFERLDTLGVAIGAVFPAEADMGITN